MIRNRAAIQSRAVYNSPNRSLAALVTYGPDAATASEKLHERYLFIRCANPATRQLSTKLAARGVLCLEGNGALLTDSERAEPRVNGMVKLCENECIAHCISSCHVALSVASPLTPTVPCYEGGPPLRRGIALPQPRYSSVPSNFPAVEGHSVAQRGPSLELDALLSPAPPAPTAACLPLPFPPSPYQNNKSYRTTNLWFLFPATQPSLSSFLYARLE